MLFENLFPFIFLLGILGGATTAPSTDQHAVAGMGFIDPAKGGGSSLAYFPDRDGGEPLNVIVSGASSTDLHTIDGFTNWSISIGFGIECGNVHLGAVMSANLGDGRRKRKQTGLFRQLYGEDPRNEGACKEIFRGGNHFRFWQQSTTHAWFLAASKEKSLEQKHAIVPDGYDIGRDLIVKAAIAGSSYSHTKYQATAQYVTGLLKPGSHGINHDISIDGRTAVLIVTSTHT